ncbi:MAG: GTP 3',8-cyclase MoaA [Nitrospinae bacterium]|nr:GTP 3',8-cyclase MoaA [Nitrospinota bacterium]
MRDEHPWPRLVDGAGRGVEYLRMSVTDRCDMKCAYCMPTGGAERAEGCDMLKFSEFLTLAEIFARMGVRKIRLTGGEPLVRKGILGFVRALGRVPGVEQIALTTNGVRLPRMAAELKEAGIDTLNISLDSLRPDRYAAITGLDTLTQTLDGIRAALAARFERVKVNVVVMKGVNDDEIAAFARMSLSLPVQVRFIEFMPATPSVWSEARFMNIDAVRAAVEEIGELTPATPQQWGGPAKVYRLPGAAGEVGFIAAVSRHFCDDCNRLRLTSSGKLMTCLFGKEDLDLAASLRGGADPRTIADSITAALAVKNAVRTLPGDPHDRTRPSMTCIGG